MNDNCFIDTNILIYCYTNDEPIKREKAITIANKPNVYISTLVLTEFSNTLRKKYKYDWPEIELTLNEIKSQFPVFINKPETIIKACQIGNRYKYSFYDSLIISSALSCNCKILYSEDMQHNQIIEGKLKIINPFI